MIIYPEDIIVIISGGYSIYAFRKLETECTRR